MWKALVAGPDAEEPNPRPPCLHPQQYGSFFPPPNGQRAVELRPTSAAPDPPSMWSSPPRYLAQGSPPKENRHLFLTISLHLDFYLSTLFVGDIPPLCFSIRYTFHHIGFVPAVHFSQVEIIFFAVGAFHSLKNSFRFFSDAQKGLQKDCNRSCKRVLAFCTERAVTHP